MWPCGLAINSWPLHQKLTFQYAAPQISSDSILHLLLPEDHGAQEGLRSYSTEELKELLNKLMLMSGKKDHSSSVEVEKFAEVSIWVCATAPLTGWLWSHAGPGTFLTELWKCLG